jgi:hypothetical protein
MKNEDKFTIGQVLLMVGFTISLIVAYVFDSLELEIAEWLSLVFK